MPHSRSHSSTGASTVEIGDNAASVWVKIVSSWVCAVCPSLPVSPSPSHHTTPQLLYIWSLIAPICLPDRDFS